jgi:hypothetical protein
MMRVSFQGWGGDAYPAETPQYEEDHPYLHDEPDYEPGSGEYNFFFGNGQLHVSPHHDHDELRGHANVGADSTGPVAVGQVSVEQGRATWTVDGNVSLRALSKALKDYTKQVGWKWHGLTSSHPEHPSTLQSGTDTSTSQRRPSTFVHIHRGLTESSWLEGLHTWIVRSYDTPGSVSGPRIADFAL